MQNDFLPFGTASGAQVLSQSAYADITPAMGFPTGILYPQNLNKAIRQGSFMANGIGAFLNEWGQNAVDDGVTANLLAAIDAAITAKVDAVIAAYDLMTAKAWVTFNSAGGVLGGFNISSVTKVSTGLFTVTFVTAMANANYALSGSTMGQAGAASPGPFIYSTDGASPVLKSATAVQVATINGSGLNDVNMTSVVIHCN